MATTLFWIVTLAARLFLNAALKNIPYCEYEALKSLYNCTQGWDWNWRPVETAGAHWVFPKFGVSNPCAEQWQGLNCSLTCYNETDPSECHVSEISLRNYNLVGNISSAIGNLTDLYRLDLSDNELSGSIPSTIGLLTRLAILELAAAPPTSSDAPRRLMGQIPSELYDLQNLFVLDVSFNSLDGSISSAFGSMRNLSVANFAGNLLVGPLPTEIGLLTQLSYLTFFNNRLTSSIPSEIRFLSGIAYLDLSVNSLTGTLPSDIGDLVSVEELYFFNNSLSGTIPESVSVLKNLFVFGGMFNYLSGSIPSLLSNAGKIHNLWVQGNSLTGSLPSELALLDKCAELDFGLNLLSGTIPTTFGEFSEMRSLDGPVNYITGTIPSELGQMQTFQLGTLSGLAIFLYANLAANMLTGTIPSTLGLWSHLNYLYIYGNSLTGPIPTEFGQMEHMYILMMDHNSLEGPIPTEIGTMVRLNEFEVSGNSLTGTLPTELGLLTDLWTFHVQTNSIQGTLPEALSALNRLTVLGVCENAMTGSIPNNLPKNLMVLLLCDNGFTGTIPSTIGSMSYMETLILANNYLQGELEPIFSPLVENSQLDTVDLSNNNFFGSVPQSLFLLPKINSISLIKNCFRGSIPSSVCNTNASLSVIALDGLSAGSACETVIFSVLHTYTSSYMKGSIPECVFSLPGLTTLQISGNGLTGTLPSTLPENSVLRNVSLSNNRLHGTIPDVFQTASFQLLDLSNNRFHGTINGMKNFFDNTVKLHQHNVTVRSPQLVLNDNRLSGKVPSSFRNVENIDIVGGNFFGCDATSELPKNDPATATADCGSNTLDLSVVVFACGFGLIAALLLVRLYRSWRGGQLSWQQESSDNSRDSTASNDRASINEVEIIYFNIMLPATRNMMFLFAVPVTLFVLLPLYLLFKYVNNGQYSTHTYQYGLTPSIAFLEGTAPFVAFSVLFLAIAASVVWLFGSMNRVIKETVDVVSHNVFREHSIRISWASVESVYSKHSIDDLKSIGKHSRSIARTILTHPTVLNSIFVITNLVIFVLVNGAFVFIILTFGQAESIVAQIALAAFKLGWNQVVIPNALKRINRSKSNVKHNNDSQNFGSTRSATVDLNAFLVVFNTVVIPIVLVMVESFNCFFYTFKSPDTLTLVQYYKVCYVVIVDSKCLEIDHKISTSFVPPFIYNFGCSNALLINYTSVFVLMYIYLGLISPIIHGIISFVLFTVPGDSDDYLDRVICSSEEFTNFLPDQLGTERSSTIRRSTVVRKKEMSNETIVPSNGVRAFLGKYCVAKYRSVERFVCRLISDFAVLFTFGMAYPPLAAIVCLSVFIEHYEWILLFTRNNQLQRSGIFKQKSDDSSDRTSTSLQCQGIVNVFGRFRWVLVTLLCWFFGLVLFDMSGDVSALSMSLCGIVFVWPLALYVLKNLKTWIALGAWKQIKKPKVRTESQDFRSNVELPVIPATTSLNAGSLEANHRDLQHEVPDGRCEGNGTNNPIAVTSE